MKTYKLNDLNNPLISVLMPAYNAEKYIKEAIESILNQTFSNFEYILNTRSLFIFSNPIIYENVYP